jgi:hypothetical protein
MQPPPQLNCVAVQHVHSKDNFSLLNYYVVPVVVYYTQAVLKFTKLITEAQQREAVTRERSLPPIPATVYSILLNAPCCVALARGYPC